MGCSCMAHHTAVIASNLGSLRYCSQAVGCCGALMRPASGSAVIGFFAPAASFQETHLKLLRVSVGQSASRIQRPCNMNAVDDAVDVEPAVLASSSLRLRAHLPASLPATVPSGHSVSIFDVPEIHGILIRCTPNAAVRLNA